MISPRANSCSTRGEKFSKLLGVELTERPLNLVSPKIVLRGSVFVPLKCYCSLNRRPIASLPASAVPKDLIAFQGNARGLVSGHQSGREILCWAIS
jgi:hypothetical protein